MRCIGQTISLPSSYILNLVHRNVTTYFPFCKELFPLFFSRCFLKLLFFFRFPKQNRLFFSSFQPLDGHTPVHLHTLHNILVVMVRIALFQIQFQKLLATHSRQPRMYQFRQIKHL